MAGALFYQLSRHPLEVTLPILIGKARERGWRIEVRGSDPARMDWLDRKLWMGEGFLPHGLSGGPHDADQPVLLTVGATAGADAPCLMAVDGAEVSADEVARAERVCILFDGGDDAALARARDQWRALTGAGARAEYWSEETGRWTKKAESKG